MSSGLNPAAAVLILVDQQGWLTQADQAVDSYRAAAMVRTSSIDQGMYLVSVMGWPPEKFTPEDPVRSPAGARFVLRATEPADDR